MQDGVTNVKLHETEDTDQCAGHADRLCAGVQADPQRSCALGIAATSVDSCGLFGFTWVCGHSEDQETEIIGRDEVLAAGDDDTDCGGR